MQSQRRSRPTSNSSFVPYRGSTWAAAGFSTTIARSPFLTFVGCGRAEFTISRSWKATPALGLELMDQILGCEVLQLPLIADSCHGNDFGLRQEPRERQLSCVAKVEPKTSGMNCGFTHRVVTAQEDRTPPTLSPIENSTPPEDFQCIAQDLPESS